MKFTVLFSLMCFMGSFYALGQTPQPNAIKGFNLLKGSHTNHTNGRAATQKLDSLRVIRFDDWTLDWETSSKTEFEYYADGTLKKQSTNMFDANKEHYSFLPNGKISQTISQINNGSTFENDLKTLYTYNSQGHHTTDTNYQWNGVFWEISGFAEYQTTPLGYITEKITYTISSGTTVPISKYTFTNDSLGNTLNLVTFQYLNGIWMNHINYTYTYNSLGRTTEHLNQLWDNGQWVNNMKTQFTYANNNRILLENLEWNGSSWSLAITITSQFETNVSTQSLWLPGHLTLNDHMIIGEQTEVYNTTWGYLDSTLFFYSDVNPNSIVSNPAELDYQILNNPVSSQLKINNPSGLNSTVQVYSITGKQVKNTNSSSSEIQVDVHDLPIGLYLVHIQNGSHKKVFNVVISH